MQQVNVAILGHGFMGRVHSNGWSQAAKFFDVPVRPVLKVACGRDRETTQAFADRWGWETVETDWRAVIARPDVDVVDISLPQTLHAEAAMLAAEHGKHIFCEKPLSITSAEAEAMIGAVEKAGVVHYLNHNYRRVPAVCQARRMMDEGAIGQIYHWRGAYQQSWLLDPNKPLDWKLKKETAFAGPHYDLNSHSVDLAHYLVGDIETVSCLTRTFIEERPLAEDPSKMGRVEIDDASLMTVEFENGAIGSFEASRFATGRRNHHTFEIYGSRGALCFDLEHLNRLQFYSMDDAEAQRGFRDILVTEPSHPYVGSWWPPGHVIGYEHSFVHAVADFLRAVHEGASIKPDFYDGLKIVKVLEAGLASAERGQRIRV